MLSIGLVFAGKIFAYQGLQAENLAGLNVGDKAPSFELKNQKDETVKLSALLEHGPVAIVFYRSADWCPFCQKHLVAMQEGLVEINAAGLQLVAISYEPVDVLARFASKRGIKFSLLSDSGSAEIKAWKLLNEEAKGRAEGIPNPMTYIVGKDGVISAKLGHEGYKARHSVQELVDAAKTSGEK